ncbi:MAG: 16S rRNA (guanine(966)-N(2))-methyltransferase RsmD [Erysipelotrichales bacterium]|nr:MAG: 16S rRNA (guanine(966)-N(2))-methyltransferase RsmD [Erysipelotrichales bacterium]
MRIVGGRHRSRLLTTSQGKGTRPTMDKVREALYDRLGQWVIGKAVLDLFAGSGSVALEGISRGMVEAVLVDGSASAIEIIQKNVDLLKETDVCKVLRMEATQALRYLKNKGHRFDLIYLDPPYGKVDLGRILTLIHHYDLLNDEGYIVVETLDEDSIPFGDFILEKKMTYGFTALHYLRRKNI